jgi:hypothetical protein
MKALFTLLFTVSLITVHPVYANGEKVANYTLKPLATQENQGLGRGIIFGSVIPLNKTYGELNASQQAALKAQYRNMGQLDEPPFPKNGLEGIYRTVSRLQKGAGVSGVLDILVTVDETGNPIGVIKRISPDQDLARAVAEVLMMQDYKPALCNTQPCKMVFPFTVNFSAAP